MPQLGIVSQRKLATCHEDIQRVMNETIKIVDFAVIEGHRGKDRQNELQKAKRSQLNYPNSNHNKKPALAVDIIPWPKGFKSSNQEWEYLAALVLATAKRMDIKIHWGGHWRTLRDCPHFEL